MFHKVDPKSLNENVFSLIGDKWMLITAGSRERCNTMTASWGGLGVIWGAPAATCYIRPQRYTKEFVDREEYFTLCFFGEEYRKALSLCGSKSGRDVDKVKECGFTVQAAECGAPYFDQALCPAHGPGQHPPGREGKVVSPAGLSHHVYRPDRRGPGAVTPRLVSGRKREEL